MIRPGLQALAIAVLIITCWLVHAGAREIVGAGLGIPALIAVFASLPFLARYLD